jgi:hypothetical protein
VFAILNLLFIEPIDNNKRKTTKTNPSRSKDQAIKPTADEVSDLGVSALPSSESEESDSGNEEVDWLAPSPPPRTRNKIPRTDVVIIKSVFIITGMHE